MIKFKKKLVAALVALAAAGSAHAAVDFTSGDGSLFLNLTTPAGTSGNRSAAFDLGFTMNQALTWNGVAGLQLQWNLTSGAFSSNDSTLTGPSPTLNYGSALTTFQSNSNYSLSTAQMSVLAFDPTDNGSILGVGGSRIMTTQALINATTGATIAIAPGNTPSNGGFTNTFTQVATFQSGINNNVNIFNTMSSANGASVSDFGQAGFYGGASGASSMSSFLNNFTGMDNTGVYGGQYTAGSTTFSGQNKALPFFMFATDIDPLATKAARTAFGVDLDLDGIIEQDNNGALSGGNELGLWTLQGDILTFSNPGTLVTTAPIPEPSTYAMMLAGLALLGSIARRRMS